MLAELMSGKWSGVLWREGRGSPLVLPWAEEGELQMEGRNQEREDKG